MTERVGLFGGSFDPPHLGHLILAESARVQLELDVVVWIPTGDSYHKDAVSDADRRFELVQHAISDQPAFIASRWDIERAGPTYSVDTALRARAEFPDAELFFIVGTDAFAQIDSWHAHDHLEQLVTFAVGERPGSPGFSERRSVRWVQLPEIGISSSDIRERCRRSESTKYLIPDAVRDTIDHYRLYSEDA